MDFYQYGYDLFQQQKGDSWPGWHAMPEGYGWKKGLERPSSGYYDEACRGYETAKIDYLRPYVIEFLHEYELLSSKYNCSILTGCGCCGDGYYVQVEGEKFSFDPSSYIKEINNDE